MPTHHNYEPVLIAPHSPNLRGMLIELHTFRNYMIVVFGGFVAFGLHALARAWLVEELTSSPILVTATQAVTFAPLLFFTAFGGIFADWLNRKVIIVIGDVVYLATFLTLTSLVFFDVVQVWHILTLASINGTAFAFSVSSRQTFYTQLVPQNEVKTAASAYTLSINVAQVGAPLLGALILPIGGFGIELTMLISAIVLLATTALFITIKTVPRKSSEKTHKSVLTDLKEGAKYAMRTPKIRVILVMFLVSIMTLGPFNALLPVFAGETELNVGSAGFSVLTLGNGLGSIGGALFIALRGKISFQKYGPLFVLIAIVTMALFAFSESYPISILIIVVRGFAVGSFLSLSLTSIAAMVSPSLRGRVLGIRFMLIGLAPIGTISIGVLGENYGVRTASYIMSGIALLLLASIFIVPKLLPKKPPKLDTPVKGA